MHTLNLMSVSGPFRVVKSVNVPDRAQAKIVVEAYATEHGFHSVKAVDDLDYSIRFTATTPGGRPGRNLAFLNVGYEGDEIATTNHPTHAPSYSCDCSDCRASRASNSNPHGYVHRRDGD